MNELVKIDQDVTIVPRDFNFTNMGSVTEVTPQGFRMKMKYPTSGIKQNYICEFYSHTQMVFFSSHHTHQKLKTTNCLSQTLSNTDFYKDVNSLVSSS